nr:MAG TPA: hypothetical protein [Crassvirales sp.]
MKPKLFIIVLEFFRQLHSDEFLSSIICENSTGFFVFINCRI